MIILEEVAEQTKDDKFNGLTLRHPQTAYTRSTASPLPDYETSEAQHRDVIIPSSKFKLDAKSWRAALIALCLYIFLTLTIAVPIIVLKSKDNASNQPQYPPVSPAWPADYSNSLPIPYYNKMAFGVPPPNETTTCNNWQTDLNSPNSVMASFQLPPSDCITIQSNATYNSITSDRLNGILSVSMNDNSQESSILFTVEMQSSSKDIQDRTTICFSEEGSNRGLSIFIPSDIGDDTLAINIHVLLPRVNSKMDTFTTCLPMFSQDLDFGDFPQYLSFDQFSLEGSHRFINSTHLHASQISVTNVLSSIQGSFNVTQSLSLESIRGPIIADIMLSPSSDQTQPTTLSLGTGNSSINASITLNALTTPSVSPSSPAFAAQVTNFDGPLQVDVAYGNTSLPSPFQLNVQNNVAPSIISMDSIFQGCFTAQAKLSQVFVHNTSRTLDYDTSTPDIAMGWVGNGGRPASYQAACHSFINILSALGPVNLTFGS